MKRLGATFLLVILFTGCVTHHYGATDYPQKPLPRPAAYIAGIVPGLPQLINGEYGEAALYFGLAGLGFLMYQFPQGLSDGPERSDTYPYKLLTEDEKKQKLKETSNAGLAFAGMVTAYSYIDGVCSTNERYNEWKSVDDSFQLELQRQSDEERILAEEKKQREETQKELELARLKEESGLREKKNALKASGYPLCLSSIEVQKNYGKARVSLSLANVTDKPMQFVLLEIRPLDSTGQWILPSDTSATNVRTIRVSSEIQSDKTAGLSEEIDWWYNDLSDIEIMYLKINYTDGTSYEQNDADVLNRILILKQGDQQ